jgi:hypothetical protein
MCFEAPSDDGKYKSRPWSFVLWSLYQSRNWIRKRSLKVVGDCVYANSKQHVGRTGGRRINFSLLKGPKHEIFESGFFTEIRPVRIGDLGTGEKK